jgi:hypothetical protein
MSSFCDVDVQEKNLLPPVMKKFCWTQHDFVNLWVIHLFAHKKFASGHKFLELSANSSGSGFNFGLLEN